jgi:hypothetical protein
VSRRTPFALVVLLSLWMLFSPGSTVPSGPPYSDKVVHAALFAALALTGVRAGIRPVLLLMGLAVYACGAADPPRRRPCRRGGGPPRRADRTPRRPTPVAMSRRG